MGRMERTARKHTHHHMYNRRSAGSCSMTPGVQPGALGHPAREAGWGGRWEGGSRGKGHMYAYG